MVPRRAPEFVHALTALAMKERDDSWRSPALVGRDLLSGVSLGDIPLMRHIADRSANVHFLQR